MEMLIVVTIVTVPPLFMSADVPLGRVYATYAIFAVYAMYALPENKANAKIKISGHYFHIFSDNVNGTFFS